MIEYPILPVVRQGAGILAGTTRYSLAGCAAMALAELVLLPLHLPLAGILCGMFSSFLLGWSIALVAVLAAWGHAVLLAGQGLPVTRWLVYVGAMLAPLVPACWLYTLVTGNPLMYRQAELPIILGVVVFLAALLNLPRMAAAPWQLQGRIIALPLLLLLSWCADAPGLLVFSAIFKLLAAWLGMPPLAQLASLAPRIISLPERK